MSKYSAYFDDRKRKSTPKYAVEECHHSRDAIYNPPYYTFHVPPTWQSIPSQNKSIGVRRFSCIPKSYYIELAYAVFIPNADGKNLTYVDTDFIYFTAQSENTSEEIMTNVTNMLNESIEKLYAACEGDARFEDRKPPKLKYDIAGSEYRIYVLDDSVQGHESETIVCIYPCGQAKRFEELFSISEDGYTAMSFKALYAQFLNEGEELFQTGKDDMDTPFKNFNRFFNQPTRQQYILNNSTTLTNVWDRRNLYVHSDIASHTTNSFLCRINDFYYKPSKLYVWTDSSPKFRVWFSFDGINPSNFYHEDFILELCYLADVNDSFALG